MKWATEIDDGIAVLVRDLNAAGWKTCSSCQGRTSAADYQQDRHTEHAFITFNREIPPRLRRRARALGLVAWNGNITISPDYEDEARRTYMTRNAEFPAAVRKLFLSRRRAAASSPDRARSDSPRGRGAAARRDR